MTHFWHPFANMAEVDSNEFVVARADGNYVFGQDGRKYLDASASLWCANVGHGRREIADAVHAQILELDTYTTFGEVTNPRAEELAERLADLSPLSGARVFLGSGGGDGIEAAAKIARQYWRLRDQPRRQCLIGREGGYHGTHGFGTSIGGIGANRTSFDPLVGANHQVDCNSAEALEACLVELGPDSVAAFFCEPVLGAGGVHAPPPGYIEAVAAICRQYGVLFVVDSVICAFGRLGTWFGIERWPGVEPDMITFAKGVTGAYLPLGGVVASERVAEPFWSDGGAMFRHGTTYAGHATCCAAALANIEILEREDLVSRGRDLEDELARLLRPLAERSLVSEVRAGLGLLGAVQIDSEALAANPKLSLEIQRAVRARGVLVRPLPDSLAISPPLTITSSELSSTAEAIDAALIEAET